MSTPTITPDQPQATSTLGAVAGQDPSQTASPVNLPAGSFDNSAVSAVVSAPPDNQPAQAPKPTSRLAAIMSAVANVASTALSGVPDRGRPSFVTGLGEGARAEQANIANQQAIKFKTFDDQVRAAQLHNQDLAVQNATQAENDAHTKAELDNRALANSLGIDFDTLPNHGPAVIDHLTAQTSASGAASVPAGTHVSGDGDTIYIPQNTQATRAGQKKMYTELAPALGLPPLPEGAQFVPDRNMNMLQNKVLGYDLGGNRVQHQDLPGAIAAEKTQRDNLAKNGGSPNQLKALDNVIAIHQAQQDALDEHADSVADAASQRKQDEKTNQIQQQTQQKLALQNNAAKNKQQGDTTNLDSVAYDPNYQNADGSKGANVVMSKADAAAKGLTHYKADPSTINTVVAGMNDVQNKLNQLATVVNDPNRFGQVEPFKAAQMIAHGKAISLEFGGHGGGASGGIGVDTSGVNEKAYQAIASSANQATKDYVTAYLGAHEAITQLPRLQTFGKSNRMTEKQMEAAQNLLPQPGDGTMAGQKMSSLQGMIDPLRKQIPHMPGAETTPSWLEQRQQQQRQTPSGGSNLSRAVMGDATGLVNRLVPSN